MVNTNNATIQELRAYYGTKEFESMELVLDINESFNESLEALEDKISEFTLHKGTSYVEFIDSSKSIDNVVVSYQLLEMNMKEDLNIRLFDVYGSNDCDLRNISLRTIAEKMHEDIKQYVDQKEEDFLR